MHEASYIKIAKPQHRKDFGQFFTPFFIARKMAKWILSDKPETILDPAFGMGVFKDAIDDFGYNNAHKMYGCEIDADIYNFYRGKARKQHALRLKNCDYLEEKTRTYDSIICNPPYMRFQNFINRHNVLPLIEKTTGSKLKGYSNTASVFLVKAINELSDNGRLSFIMPFEFFNTGYGREIRSVLLNDNLLKQIVIFENESDIFAEVATTVCVILCRNDHRDDGIGILKVRNMKELSEIECFSDKYDFKLEAGDLPCDKKWSPIIERLYTKFEIPNEFVSLREYGTFKRGIATGANEFFALNNETIKKWSLPAEDCIECITKSIQIKQPVFSAAHLQNLANDNKPVKCLNAEDTHDKNTIQYIRHGEKCEFHRRYLTANRRPWYAIEHRAPSQILMGVFNRGRLKVVRNYTEAVNFTCFHSFYPNLWGEKYIDELFLYFMSDYGQKVAKQNKRIYGNNLEKLEPGDLNDCFVPSFHQLDLIEKPDIKEAMKICQNDEKAAISMSNKLFEPIFSG